MIKDRRLAQSTTSSRSTRDELTEVSPISPPLSPNELLVLNITTQKLYANMYRELIQGALPLSSHLARG